MQLIRLIMVRNREAIRTLVTIRVLIIEPATNMERLMDIAQEVDQKSQSIAFSDIGVARVQPILNVIIEVTVQVRIPILLSNPADNILNSFSDVPCFNLFAIWVVSFCFTLLVNKRIIYEVVV